MTLIGMPHTPIQPNGRISLKLTIAILFLSFLITGCSAEWWAGDGRGDWTIELCAGYSINKINSNEIIFCYKDNPEDTSGSIVISNYFVISYQLSNSYIFLEGISTQKISISEEELENKDLNYYLVDIIDGGVVGPFQNQSGLVEYCNSIEVEITDNWVYIAD